MFCPKCSAEYIPGIEVCADCGVPLVLELQPVQEPEFVKYDEVLATFNPGDIAIIKSLLDCEKIDYYFHGEYFNAMQPMVQPARLMVCREQANEAREILKDLKITYTFSSEFKEPKEDK